MGRTSGKLLRKLEEWLKALKGEAEPVPVPVPVDRRKGRPVGNSLWIAIPLLLAGCQLTDHTERDDVTAEALNFPVSGYEHVDAKDLPRIDFEETHFDMGQVVQGNKVTKQFTFRNTGGSPLVLADVRGSCGCTVGKEWPRRPIEPGGTGTIEVVFDSEGRSGRQDKSVTVVANTTPPSTVLTLSGEVMGPSNIKPIE